MDDEEVRGNPGARAKTVSGLSACAEGGGFISGGGARSKVIGMEGILTKTVNVTDLLRKSLGAGEKQE